MTVLNDVTRTEYLPEVVNLSIQAGRKILQIYETDFDVEQKSDDSPLTAADMAAHETIVEGLTRLFPDIPVLSEESADIPFAERQTWETYWLVDPLDGTREFVKRNGEFTVNIALIEKGEATLGVIYAPVLKTTYAGCRGGSAWKQVDDGPEEMISVRDFSPAQPIVAGSRSHRGDSLNTFLEKLGQHHLVSMGSSLKSCLVAEGKADIYPRFGPTSEWDTAAAQAIVESAGGQLVTLDMKPMRYNTKASLLNPHFMVIGDVTHDWACLLTD